MPSDHGQGYARGGELRSPPEARLSLSSGDTYLDRINRVTGLTGEMPPSPSSWPLSVLDLSPLRHHPGLPSHMLARGRAVHYTLLARCFLLSCTHRVPFFLCLVLVVCIRWPPPCVLVELSSSQRFLSTGNRARQHIKMGHTLRAASLDLHLSRPSPSLHSNPMLFPSLFPAVIPFPGGNWAGSQGSPAPQSEFLQ